MKFILSSPFGEVTSIHPTPHSGIDLAMPENTTLRTVVSGVVDKVFDYGSQNAGKGVIVQYGPNEYAIYGHMNEVLVKKGQTLNYGDTIGLSGNTGHSTGPHLHFGIKEAGQFQDPSPFINDLNKVSGEWNHFENQSANAMISNDSWDFAVHRIDDFHETTNPIWQAPPMEAFGDLLNIMLDLFNTTII